MSSQPTQRSGRAASPKPTETKKDDDKKQDEKKDEKGGMNKTYIVLAVVVALAGAFYMFGPKVDIKEKMTEAVNFVEAQGGFLFSPRYGMWWVLAYTGTAKLCANVISVLIARFVVKDWVMRTVVAKSELLTMVSKAVAEEPWKMAFLVRGSMVPLFVKNYGLGVMDIDYLPIAVCSSIFTNFYAFQNIYMGSTLQNIQEVFAPKKASDGPVGWDQTLKKMAPIAFNVILIVFLVKSVKAQIKKQKAKIEEDLKKKEGGSTKKD